jgi:hypothetical protein
MGDAATPITKLPEFRRLELTECIEPLLMADERA